MLGEGTAYYDLKHKKRMYRKSGVKEYWIVDPMEKSIEIWENKGGEFVLITSAIENGKVKSELLAGLEINLEEIFSECNGFWGGAQKLEQFAS